MATRRPLAGVHVVVTRPSPGTGANEPFARQLRAAGAVVTAFPAIALLPPRSWAAVDRAVDALRATRHAVADNGRHARTSGTVWVVFLSANAVDRFLTRAHARGVSPRHLAGRRLAAIGPATARALRDRGLRPDAVSATPTSGGLAASLVGRVRRGDRVLIPRGDIGSDVLPRALRRRGVTVEEVTVYRTRSARGPGVERLRRSIARGAVDVLAFASAQTVRCFVDAVGRATLRRMPSTVLVASIGPVTSKACRTAGLRVGAEAEIPSFPSLVRAISRAFRHP
jgi:uroporphyrinogen-III synthase